MAKGCDVGTMFLVMSEVDDIAGGESFSVQRNCFLQANSDSDTEETLKENNWTYAKHDGNYYILGEDAIKLKNLLTVKVSSDNANMVVQKVGDLRRPMKDGILNTSEEKLSMAMIQKLISNLIGKPSFPGETLCYCAPGDPVDRGFNVIFHKTMLTNFLKSLGYSVECIPEALAIIFSERPSAVDPENNTEVNHSGIAISFGAGMANVCFAWKKMPLINFSIARSGDWIDAQAAKTAGIDVSAMTRYKEAHIDLSNVDYSDMRQAALDIYYQNMIEHALKNFSEKFNQLDNRVETPLEIVVAGGTASVKGFIPKFEQVLAGLSLPFKVKCVRLATNPLFSVAKGCLAKAMSIESKSATAAQLPKPESAESKEQEPKRIKLK